MEAKEKDMPKWEAERMILIYGKKEAVKVVWKRIDQTESDSTAMYYGKVLEHLQNSQME